MFALREPNIVGAAPDEQPTWDIWEYDLDAQLLRRVFTSDTAAREGDDVAPHYLPDGRIVFSSTRQRQSKAILLDEGKPQFAAQDENDDEHAFVLHVMNADGSGIRQVSFNQSHDLDPAVLPDGRVVFSRWDNAPGHDEISLYTMRPDGSDLQLLYGARSHATGTDGEDVHFLDPRPMANGKLLVRVQPFEAPDLGGQLLEVDTANFVEITQPTLPNRGVLTGPAQVAATINDVRTVEGPSPGGRYNAAFPLQDGTGRILLTWTQCRLLETTTASATAQIVPCTADRLAAGATSTAAPLYGVWIYDPVAADAAPRIEPRGRHAVHRHRRAAAARLAGRRCSIRWPASTSMPISRPRASACSTSAASTTSPAPTRHRAASPCCAILRSTLAAARPARFVRIEKAVSIPDDDVRDFDGSAFGVTRAFGMREILGYAPVEPDGSVRIKVPADVAFAISVLDANGRRIGGRHDNWLQLRAGQELKCNGCHVATRDDSHGRDNLFAAANAGAPGTGVPFPNTNPAFFADFGETMAQVRARISCQTDCADLQPSTSIRFTDVWTDPVAAGRPADAPFAYDYADLTTPAPTTPDCVTSWRAGCRITIHYERHLHPLWSKPRVTLAADGTVLRDDTCVACHSARAADGSARVPAAQLELTDGPSADVPTHFHAYRELLATDAEQEVVNGTLQDRLVQTGIDPVTGLPQFSTVPVAPALRAGNANGSVTFFSLFAPGGTHAGRLTPVELKLVSEWTDIGAQYFNDPFAAPLN